MASKNTNIMVRDNSDNRICMLTPANVAMNLKVYGAEYAAMVTTLGTVVSSVKAVMPTSGRSVKIVHTDDGKVYTVWSDGSAKAGNKTLGN